MFASHQALNPFSSLLNSGMVSIVKQYSTPKCCNGGAASMKDMMHLFGRCPIGGRGKHLVGESLDMGRNII